MRTAAITYSFGLMASFAMTAAAFAAEPAAHGEKSGGLPQFDMSTFPSQIFWLAVTFTILYFFFSKKTLPAISSTIESRRSQIDSDLEMAEKLRADAEASQEAFEAGLIDARDKATSIIMATQEKIKTKADKSAADFREKMEKDIAGLEKRLEESAAAAMEDMNTIAAEVASEAAQKIVGISTNLNDAKTVVESLNDRKKAA